MSLLKVYYSWTLIGDGAIEVLYLLNLVAEGETVKVTQPCIICGYLDAETQSATLSRSSQIVAITNTASVMIATTHSGKRYVLDIARARKPGYRATIKDWFCADNFITQQLLIAPKYEHISTPQPIIAPRTIYGSIDTLAEDTPQSDNQVCRKDNTIAICAPRYYSSIKDGVVIVDDFRNYYLLIGPPAK